MKKFLVLISFVLSTSLAAAHVYEPEEAVSNTLQPAGDKEDYQNFKVNGQVNTGVKSTPQTQVRISGSDEPEGEQNDKNDAEESEIATGTKRADIDLEFDEEEGWGEGVDRQQLDDSKKNIEQVLEEDKDIVEAEVKPDHVKVEYRRPAKLFGFIPVAYYHAFTVDDQGKIAQGRPWWLIFAVSDSNNFASTVESDFLKKENELRFFKVQNSLQRQSQFFQMLTNILKAQ